MSLRSRATLFVFFAATKFAYGAELQTLKFPDGFKWCVATSAYQIEGNDFNSDWWAWEKVPGKILTGEKSGVADDHWNRIKEDTRLIKDLNVQEYRMSIEWAKVEPSQGIYDRNVIRHYRDEIQTLRAANIEPMITIDHYTLPKWIAEKGGWAWPEIVDEFQKYTRVIYTEIAPEVKTWVTLNEPEVHVLLAYQQGVFPPGKTSMSEVTVPMINMLRAHAAAYHELHALARKRGEDDIKVGIAYHLRIFDPESKLNYLERIASDVIYDSFDWSFPDAVENGTLNVNIPGQLTIHQQIEGLAQTQDFIGLNYYSRDMIRLKFNFKNPLELMVNRTSETTDTKYEIYPEGLYRILKLTHGRYPNLRIRITENGIADSSDTKRPQFILDHLEALYRAISEGVPVDGYCHWSLMDNFEWQTGYAPRFGLYEVDFKTQKRTLRASGALFSEIARANSIEVPEKLSKNDWFFKVLNYLGLRNEDVGHKPASVMPVH